ncbi:hypothetical protein Tco_0212698 [Tanacetum coccineum]
MQEIAKETVAQEEREEVAKEPTAKRKKSIPRKTTRKRQKLEEDVEKDELKGFLDIVPREETPIEIESLSTKFPIVILVAIVARIVQIHKSSSAEMTKVFERIISSRRRIEDFIQKKLVDLKDNHKFREECGKKSS